MKEKFSKAREKNLPEIWGGMLALWGLFLPYVPRISLIQFFNRVGYTWLPPMLVLGIALSCVLYAFGWKELPILISMILVFISGGYLCNTSLAYGFWWTLTHLRLGAWLFFAGLGFMAWYPLGDLEPEPPLPGGKSQGPTS